MTVYVDSEDYEIFYNSFSGKESLEPIYGLLVVENIHDYTKQVRKEVCDEIKEKIIKRFNGVIQGHYSEEHKDGYSHCCSDIEYNILDQIQGENEC